LRSGVSAETLIEQLKGIRGPMPAWSKHGLILSIPDAMANVLEQHISRKQGSLQLHFNKSAEPELLNKGEKAATLPMSGQSAQTEVVLKQVVKTPAGSVSGASIANAGFAPECPECHSVLQMKEGCMSCQTCGYSKCA
jgi:ribonucleoside-diphosphate reductase alpha chain